MGTGFEGAFVISWAQTEVDGRQGAPTDALVTGAAWVWRGETLRVDGPADVLRLGEAEGSDDLHQRAARMVSRLVGAALNPKPSVPLREPLLTTGFVVTEGTKLYRVSLVATGPGKQPLLMFVNDIPPSDQDLWVVETMFESRRGQLEEEGDGGIICFTPGTRIDTPDGPRLIEDLRQGDMLQTRDSGPQELLWIGSRRVTGARLFVMPQLRPIRIRAGALDEDRPEDDLIVSPDHQLLVSGDAVRDLFNEREVLVAAKHLVNDRSITLDKARRHVTYIHLLLPRHEVLTANGVPCESFHPAHANLDALSPEDLSRLTSLFPDLGIDPLRYGVEARRVLSKGEAAVMGDVA